MKLKSVRPHIVAALIAIGLILILFVKGCLGPEPAMDTELSNSGEPLYVGVEKHRVTVKTPAESVTKYVPTDGRVELIVTGGGIVDLTVKESGIAIRPVIGPIVTERLQLGIGAQIAYWNRLGLFVGAAVPAPYAGFVAVGYSLDQIKLENTSLYVGYTTQKQIAVGAFLRF